MNDKSTDIVERLPSAGAVFAALMGFLVFSASFVAYVHVSSGPASAGLGTGGASEPIRPDVDVLDPYVSDNDSGAAACIDDVTLGALTSVAGAGAVIGSNSEDPCWKSGVEQRLSELENATENESIDEVMASASMTHAHMNDKWTGIDRWDSQTTYRASFHGKLAALEVFYNNSSEQEFVDAAYAGRDDYISSRHAEYDAWWNTVLADVSLMETKEPNGTDIIKVGVVNQTSGSITWYDDQYTVQNISKAQNLSTTHTLADGTTVDVVPFYNPNDSSDTLSYLDSEVVVKAVDPNTGEEQIIVGKDLNKEYGAVAYNPTDDGHSPQTADIVVAQDGSGDYSDVKTAYNNVENGSVIYVEEGNYTVRDLDLAGPANVTLVGDGATLWSDYERVLRDSGSNNVTVKGFIIDGRNNDQYRPPIDVSASGAVFDHLTVYANPGGHTIETGGGIPDAITNSLVFEANPDIDTANITTTGTKFVDSPFDSRFTPHADRLDNASQTVADRFGNASETDGYLHKTYVNLDDGVIQASDVLTRTELQQISTDEDFVGSEQWVDTMLSGIGIGTTQFNHSYVIQMYENDSYIDGTEVANTREVEAHIATQNPPEGGWDVNTTYHTDELGSPVFVTYKVTKERWNSTSQTYEVYTELQTRDLTGKFTVNNIVNSETGEQLDHADHQTVDDADYDNPNEELLATISDYEQKLNEHQDTIDCILNESCYYGEDDGTATGDTGGVSDTCGWSFGIPYPTFSATNGFGTDTYTVCTGIQSAVVGIPALIGGAYILLKVGRWAVMIAFPEVKALLEASSKK